LADQSIVYRVTRQIDVPYRMMLFEGLKLSARRFGAAADKKGFVAGGGRQ
jgi:hypothetical protein